MINVKYFYAFVATLIVLVVLDAIWLKMVMGSIFKTELGDLALPSPRVLPAVFFYVMYALGVVVFVVLPNSLSSSPSTWQSAFLVGALFGLIAFGTYDLTNMATLKAWSWKLASIDMAWGTFVTAASAAAGRAMWIFAS